MNKKVLEFRNSCAVDGIELTPQEAENVISDYADAKNRIQAILEENPNFLQDICGRTKKEKMKDLQEFKKMGCKITLKDYNEVIEAICLICDAEGFI